MEAPSGLLLLVPAPDRCLPDRRTRNKPRGPAGEKPPATGKPYAQKQNGRPPQLTTTDCAASSTTSRILVRNARNAYMASSISDYSQCDLQEHETNQVPAEPKPFRVS